MTTATLTRPKTKSMTPADVPGYATIQILSPMNDDVQPDVDEFFADAITHDNETEQLHAERGKLLADAMGLTLNEIIKLRGRVEPAASAA